MKDQEKFITLYPSHWLYNAGVVGLLEVITVNQNNLDDFLKPEGTVNIPSSYFHISSENKLPKGIKYLVQFQTSENEVEEWKHRKGKIKNKEGKKVEVTYADKYKNILDKVGEIGYQYIKTGNSLFASKTPFQNLIQLSEWESLEFPNLISKIPEYISEKSDEKCGICLQNPVVIKNEDSKLEVRLAKLQISHLKELGASEGAFPNAFWSFTQTVPVCLLCSFLIIHHKISFLRLSDGTEIFINAPSFKLMYDLNKFAKKVLGSTSKGETGERREILAMSIIEYATKIQTTLGAWSKLDIEIISKTKAGIDFFSLPSDVISLISDREIASQLSSIGEFKILNLVLDRKFQNLVEIGYRIMREALSPRRNNKYIWDTLYLQKNRDNLLETASQILKLYALIEDKFQTLKQKNFVYG